MIILSEADAFIRLREGLAMAKDGAQMLAAHRPDQAHMWNKMAETYEICMQSCWKLMEESIAGVTRQ